MKFLMAILLAFVTPPSFANTVLIDFQSLEHNDNSVKDAGFTYNEKGFKLQNLSSPFPFATFGTLESRYKGSTALFNNTRNGLTRLEKTDSGPFSLKTIDLADLNNTGSIKVNFTGLKTDGSTVSQSFTGTGNLNTYAFTGFTKLVKVESLQDGDFHQFDNINLSDDKDDDKEHLLPTPLPSAVWLFSSGILGFTLIRRKSQI